MHYDLQTINGWKELGFYYQIDDDCKQWWLIGSKAGLSNFIKEPSSKNISGHVHLGPYQYLKIMTWMFPIINKDCVGGSVSDLIHLARIIEVKLSST